METEMTDQQAKEIDAIIGRMDFLLDKIEVTLEEIETYEPPVKPEKNMQDNKYTFVSKSEEVDYLRILQETPKGTLFVLVEEKTRTNKPRQWSLFVHNSVLHNDHVQGKKLCGQKINPNWGITSLPVTKDFPYRYIANQGKFPGVIKQQIEKLRRSKSEKDTLTKVTYV